MLVKVYLFLNLIAWSLMKIDGYLVDSRVSLNEIPQFDPEIIDNSINDYLTPIKLHPLVPFVPYKFIEEPDDTHAQLGTSQTLNCQISHTNGTVQWTKNNFGLGVDRDLMAYKRYSMIGDEKSGSYSLHIINVNFKDEGFYQCQFSNEDVQMRSRYATVSVFRADNLIKNGHICFTSDDVKHERFKSNGGLMNKISVNFVIIFGIFNICIFM